VAISRIHTFSDLYSQLQDKEDVAHIRMDQFLHSLVSRLLDTGKILDQPELQVETEEVVLPLDRAVTVGLILNELIFNFLEESTSAYIKGRTTVSLKRQGNSIEVILSRKKAEAICTNHPVCTDARSLRHELIQSLLMYVDGTIEDRGTERIVKIRMG
ncbi:MAG: hypothetical protein N2442_06985, partial [Spirochaetes bacterium]|nr:hypothetical protein [Spirochaetota bacterium]